MLFCSSLSQKCVRIYYILTLKDNDVLVILFINKERGCCFVIPFILRQKCVRIFYILTLKDDPVLVILSLVKKR